MKRTPTSFTSLKSKLADLRRHGLVDGIQHVSVVPLDQSNGIARLVFSSPAASGQTDPMPITPWAPLAEVDFALDAIASMGVAWRLHQARRKPVPPLPPTKATVHKRPAGRLTGENARLKQEAIDRRAKAIGVKAGFFTTWRDLEAAEVRRQLVDKVNGGGKA